jgi:hydrogenase nickel incorporation protein HypA/HybF
MHELPVTESILQIALRHAEQAGAAQITDIYLVIGQLSTIIDESIRFYWDMLGEGTAAEGSKLHFERLELVMQCQACQHKFTPKDLEYVCPACEALELDIVQGNEFYMDSIQVIPADNDKPS